LSEYCEDCEAEDCRCTTHGIYSPIVTFKRLRIVYVVHVGGGWYHVYCSCLYQPAMGVACHHVGCILEDILPHHCINRHHTKFQPFYRTKGAEHITAEFDRSKGDSRLLITHDEYVDLLANAAALEKKHSTKLPSGFWEDVGPAVNPGFGSVTLPTLADDGNGLAEFGNGMMSQDVCLSQDDGMLDEDELELALAQGTMRSDDTYDSLRSMYTQMADLARLSADPTLDLILLDAFASALAKGRDHMRKKLGHQDESYAGTIVSSHSTIDTTKDFVRLKRRSEPRRRGKAVERTKVRLTEQSICGA